MNTYKQQKDSVLNIQFIKQKKSNFKTQQTYKQLIKYNILFNPLYIKQQKETEKTVMFIFNNSLTMQQNTANMQTPRQAKIVTEKISLK